MNRCWLHVRIGSCWAEFRGSDARELYVEHFGRPPLWARRSRMWSTNPQRARVLIEAARELGCTVTTEAA